MKETLSYNYEIKDIILDKNNINLIDIINPRQIRGQQVNSILRSLNLGSHFDAPFVINVNNGTKRIRVIDGGHRTEALKKYFEQNPDVKVKVKMIVYKDLTESQERKEYTRWNIGVKQTIDDFINCYKSEIPEYESLIAELPLSIYGSKTKMKLRFMVEAYLLSKSVPFRGGLVYSREEWLDAFKKINYDDILSMKRTFGILFEIFNPNSVIDFTRLLAFKQTTFKSLYCLVHMNEETLGRNYIIKRMKNILVGSSVFEKFRMGTRQTVVEAYIYYKQLLNGGVEHKFR